MCVAPDQITRRLFVPTIFGTRHMLRYPRGSILLLVEDQGTRPRYTIALNPYP